MIAIFQPHRYSRLKDLFDEFCQCFNNADYVFITDVCAAGESEIENFNKETLAAGISDLDTTMFQLSIMKMKFVIKAFCSKT